MLNFWIIEGREVKPSHSMEHMDGIVLFDTNIEGYSEALLCIPQHARNEGAEKATSCDLKEKRPIHRSMFNGRLDLMAS